MVEKRFMVDDCAILKEPYAIRDYLELINQNEVCNLLNSFDDTVENLTENYQILFNEYKQLKYNYNEKCNEYMGLEEQVDDLLKENEKLKRQLKRLFKISLDGRWF